MFTIVIIFVLFFVQIAHMKIVMVTINKKK